MLGHLRLDVLRPGVEHVKHVLLAKVFENLGAPNTTMVNKLSFEVASKVRVTRAPGWGCESHGYPAHLIDLLGHV